MPLAGTPPVQLPALLQFASGAAAPVHVWAAVGPPATAMTRRADRIRSDVAGMGSDPILAGRVERPAAPRRTGVTGQEVQRTPPGAAGQDVTTGRARLRST